MNDRLEAYRAESTEYGEKRPCYGPFPWVVWVIWKSDRVVRFQSRGEKGPKIDSFDDTGLTFGGKGLSVVVIKKVSFSP